MESIANKRLVYFRAVEFRGFTTSGGSHTAATGDEFDGHGDLGGYLGPLLLFLERVENQRDAFESGPRDGLGPRGISGCRVLLSCRASVF